MISYPFAILQPLEMTSLLLLLLLLPPPHPKPSLFRDWPSIQQSGFLKQPYVIYPATNTSANAVDSGGRRSASFRLPFILFSKIKRISSYLTSHMICPRYCSFLQPIADTASTSFPIQLLSRPPRDSSFASMKCATF